MDDLIRRMRLLEIDHAPDGWPAVQMCDITALLEKIKNHPHSVGEWHNAADIARIAELDQQIAHKQEQCDQLAHQVLELEQEIDYCVDKATANVANRITELEQALERIAEGESSRGYMINIARAALASNEQRDNGLALSERVKQPSQRQGHRCYSRQHQPVPVD